MRAADIVTGSTGPCRAFSATELTTPAENDAAPSEHGVLSEGTDASFTGLKQTPIRKSRKWGGRVARFQYLKPPEGWSKTEGCWVLGCGRPLSPAHGMCWNHLKRVYGRQPVFVYIHDTGYAQSFSPAYWPKSARRINRVRFDLATNWTPEPNTGCWLWLGEYTATGYTRVGTTRDPWGSYGHRAVLYFRGDEIERTHSKHVRHLCGQPACVNPDHLAYGTAKENMADRALHQRLGLKKHKVGRKRPRLTDDEVNAIRLRLARGEVQREIAKSFGVTSETVGMIARGLTHRSTPFRVARKHYSTEAA